MTGKVFRSSLKPLWFTRVHFANPFSCQHWYRSVCWWPGEPHKQQCRADIVDVSGTVLAFAEEFGRVRKLMLEVNIHHEDTSLVNTSSLGDTYQVISSVQSAMNVHISVYWECRSRYRGFHIHECMLWLLCKIATFSNTYQSVGKHWGQQ